MDELNKIQLIAIWILPVLFAITVHEVAHGWVAKKLGDPTAMMLGRLTLNPIKHIDPIGTLLVPGLLLVFGAGFIFGWAKPVPVTWENLKHPKRDMALVAIAGPLVNLLMAFIWAMLLALALSITSSESAFTYPLVLMAEAGILINLVLMLLNLLPIPPLDGGRVMIGILPGRWAWQLSRLEPYGLFILLALIFTDVLGKILLPPLAALQSFFYFIAGIGG